jgi:autotransporter family porin
MWQLVKRRSMLVWVVALSAAVVLGTVLATDGAALGVARALPDADSQALAPGSSLPSDAECAGRVVGSGTEIRPANTPFNQTRGRQKNLPGRFLSRVNGDFTGTTDEIIQWAACKWGIDADVVRAQAVKESTWFMTYLGDFTNDSRLCAPGHVLGADGKPGRCPQSIGILQAKYHFTDVAFPEAAASTAYNLDYVLGVWRTCFEGQERWLADQPPGSGYRVGDMWGCIGRWYAGDWRSTVALGYIDDVQTYYRERAWESDWFLNLRAPANET